MYDQSLETAYIPEPPALVKIGKPVKWITTMIPVDRIVIPARRGTWCSVSEEFRTLADIYVSVAREWRLVTDVWVSVSQTWRPAAASPRTIEAQEFRFQPELIKVYPV